ncbi:MULTISPECIES: TetR/AcrR family transcriptional regulator [Desulfococcus]|jgi:AcrR family transcriptional regulator|uniref:Transcriptional regulator, TetR family n=1 Tax=Desulfococcus multivorans DSM 2059 TaxID=1121405 RepID=S7U2W8_DESML|nr:TetR/AcrR family transcriptional regulator [Desulfococcus multivorans]AOY58531.1 transcriptional regulator, TetR family [Desulfococcus multivorans]AQV00843.1 TetR family transcriptional regulator [Desulfococcus multivorans]EPR43315.1 transcriptional regulator, TetR family [Desulfococcus multivorans DSM 2059]SJZ42609.1 transcriptional regulator, TetR family [Desulfococcus multivorans DSM 2059]
MKKTKLSRREREKLRQRQEMLAAALELFSEKGYHNVTVQEIAEKAEFAIGTLYKFFQNKEDLYTALVLEQCDNFESALTKVLEAPGTEIEKLQNYVQGRSEKFRNNLPFVRLFLAESKGITFNIKAGLDETIRKRYRDFLEKLALVFESGIRNKRFRNIASPYQLAVALDSIIDAFLLLWLEAPERYPYPEDPDTILDIFFKGLTPP